MDFKDNFNKNSGFSLIELAIVLVIVGVLIGSFVGTLSARIDNARIEETLEEMKTIKAALLGYAYSVSPGNPYLPCPDCDRLVGACLATSIGDGIEDRLAGGACRVGNNTGNIPWQTLGLGRDDAWGTRYTYWADSNFSNNTGFDLTTTATSYGRVEEGGGSTTAIADNLIVVVFSRGKNTYGGFSVDNVARPAVPADNVDEDNNDSGDNIFVSRPQTDPGATTAGGPFDDIVIWMSEYELKAKMVEAGKLPVP